MVPVFCCRQLESCSKNINTNLFDAKNELITFYMYNSPRTKKAAVAPGVKLEMKNRATTKEGKFGERAEAARAKVRRVRHKRIAMRRPNLKSSNSNRKNDVLHKKA